MAGNRLARPKLVFWTARSLHHQQQALEAAPEACEVVMLASPSRERLLEELADAEFLFSERSGEIDGAMIGAAPCLRLIQRLGSLAYDIDVEAARQASIPVCTMPIVGSILVAEHMLMQILVLVKRLPEVAEVAQSGAGWGRESRRTDENVFAYNWSGRSGIGGLYGRTVGILGFGEIGAELARRLRGFGVEQLLYHKRRPLPQSVESELGLTYAPVDGGEPSIYGQSDILCSLLPYSSHTDQMLNAQVFALMPPGALLVHCGSGSVIDERALADTIQRGHLGGAALDTFEWEPLRADNPLLSLAWDSSMNVLLTPHTAAGTLNKGREYEFTNVRRVLVGESLLHRL